MKILNSFILLLIVAGLSISCKKVDEDKVPSPGTKEMLTAKSWVIYKIKSNGSSNSVDESDCNSNLNWNFPTSGKFIQREDCDNHTSLTGKWTLDNNTIELKTTSSGNHQFTILSITPTNLELELEGSTYYLKAK